MGGEGLVVYLGFLSGKTRKGGSEEDREGRRVWCQAKSSLNQIHSGRAPAHNLQHRLAPF